MQITAADIRTLLGSPAGREAVLYIDDEGATPAISVWAGAHVHHSRIIARQHEVTDELGDTPDADTIADYLPTLQGKAEEVLEAIAEATPDHDDL
ncbi:hypothetical protein ABZ714_30820 [Streptomyces sp. NPDC006798]|uniref:hypothetical protein n=1 Tax=unclassified Streptomyces TaxID=2593676 RepID=UPI003328E786